VQAPPPERWVLARITRREFERVLSCTHPACAVKKNLVSCPINKFTDALDFRENRIGGRGPDERSFVCIVVCDILLDFVDQLTDVAQRATANRLLGDESEPAFDLVEPA
jgi:hypothetical protein